MRPLELWIARMIPRIMDWTLLLKEASMET